MKSAISIAALCAALMFSASMPTMAYAADKPTLAFVVNGASDFWKAAEAGVKKAQAELPDYNLELKYPEQSSVAIQQRLMDDLVTAGVKGIMVSAVDPKTSTDGLNKLRPRPPCLPRIAMRLRLIASPISVRPTSMQANRLQKSRKKPCLTGASVSDLSACSALTMPRNASRA